MHTKTKGRICIKMEFNSQKNISLLQHGRCFFVSLLQNGRCDVMWKHSIRAKLFDRHPAPADIQLSLLSKRFSPLLRRSLNKSSLFHFKSSMKSSLLTTRDEKKRKSLASHYFETSKNVPCKRTTWDTCFSCKSDWLLVIAVERYPFCTCKLL